MAISDEMLMAYADGELDAANRASVEAAMGEDPEIGKRIARHRALREAMQGAFSAVLDEAVPERLLAAARGRRKVSAPQRWQSFAMAASLLLGLGVGYLAWHGPSALIRPGSGGGLVASAALADALSNQLSDDRAADRVAITGLSYRDKAGSYCRTFYLSGNDPSSGLACREGTDWRIKALAQSPPTTANSGNFRTAASEVPPAIRTAVESSIDGEPLDHAGEIAARQAGWAAAKQ